MTAVAFDTLRLSEELRASGFTDEQARGLSFALREVEDSALQDLATKEDIRLIRSEILVVRSEMATKADVAKLEVEIKSLETSTKSDLQLLKSEIKSLETSTKSDLQLLEAKLKAESERLELRLTVKLGALMALAVGLVAALLKLYR
jgi:hypothetical protein